MSTRDRNRREGDRSEYFAQVLLSGVALATPVPRQEDIGIDFVCSLSDQRSGVLTFGHPYPSIQCTQRYVREPFSDSLSCLPYYPRPSV